MKIYISAQAQHKRDIEALVQGKAIVIIDHLLKLLIMPNSDSRKHWQGEIAGQLNRMQRLKNSNKLPTAKEIYQWTYWNNIDYILDEPAIANEVENVRDDYGFDYQGSINALRSRLDTVCSEYFSWLSEQLSTNTFLRNIEIYKKLDELV